MCFPSHCACAMFRRVVVHAARSPRRSAELDAQANILEMWRGIWWLPLSFHLHLVITNLTFHLPIMHIQFSNPPFIPWRPLHVKTCTPNFIATLLGKKLRLMWGTTFCGDTHQRLGFQCQGCPDNYAGSNGDASRIVVLSCCYLDHMFCLRICFFFNVLVSTKTILPTALPLHSAHHASSSPGK